MARKIPLTSYWMHDVIRVSESLTIDEHAWRLVQYGRVGRGRRDETSASSREACASSTTSARGPSRPMRTTRSNRRGSPL